MDMLEMDLEAAYLANLAKLFSEEDVQMLANLAM